MEGVGVLEVLNGELEQEDEQEEMIGVVRKKRRVGEKERVSDSEMRFAIEELSLVCRDEKNISTAAFLTVSNLILLVLDEIGPTMAVLRQDIKRNIERVENLYVLDPSSYTNIVEILKKEVDGGTAKKRDSCSKAVVWLARSIDFSMNLMERLIKETESSLEEVLEEAYNNNFKPWHGWISSAAYKVALKLIPNRKNFIELVMGQGKDFDLLKNDIQILFSLLQPLLTELHAHLKEFQLDMLKSR